MICAIMQPTYLPWAGYFDLVDRVDRFVFLDDVQVPGRSWAVRNRILLAGAEHYLTVPLRKVRERAERLFSNTPIDYEQDWPARHLKTIRQAYSKAPFFEPVFADLAGLLARRYATIGELNITLIHALCGRIGIEDRFCRASQIPGVSGGKDVRLAAICRALGATAYLSAQGSAAYIEMERPAGAFPAAGVELYYHHFAHPEYPQRGAGFVSHLSVVDLLMNCGYADALGVVRSGRREMIPAAEFRRLMAERPPATRGEDLRCV